MEHKHCEIIKAWADGCKIEVKAVTGEWAHVTTPSWHSECAYRIAPKEWVSSVCPAYDTILLRENVTLVNQSPDILFVKLSKH